MFKIRSQPAQINWILEHLEAGTTPILKHYESVGNARNASIYGKNLVEMLMMRDTKCGNGQ